MDDKLPLDLRREFGVEDNEAIKQILESKYMYFLEVIFIVAKKKNLQLLIKQTNILL